jgi:Rieske Fe-S protein
MNDQAPLAASLPPVRRTFLRWLTAALAAVAAMLVTIPLVGYLVGVRRRGVHWVALGKLDDFPRMQTRRVDFKNPLGKPWDGLAAYTGVYVRNVGPEAAGGTDRFLVLAVNCAHLGCPVTWFPQSGLFMCPCHGGVYYADGERASGPPPRGMFHCVWRVRRGSLEIQAPHYPTLHDTLTETA